jgi:hypothetical protein
MSYSLLGKKSNEYFGSIRIETLLNQILSAMIIKNKKKSNYISKKC